MLPKITMVLASNMLPKLFPLPYDEANQNHIKNTYLR
jgi:hypothetical protein